MEIISDTCWEWCPHCEEEVKLQSKLEMQVCPSCGEDIWPCNLCEECNEVRCPMKDAQNKINEVKKMIKA